MRFACVCGLNLFFLFLPREQGLSHTSRQAPNHHQDDVDVITSHTPTHLREHPMTDWAAHNLLQGKSATKPLNPCISCPMAGGGVRGARSYSTLLCGKQGIWEA